MKSNKISLAILILIPFIYLFPHTFRLIEMGNDFELLYFSYKKYIFEFIQVGHLPLWSPSEGLGYSLIFNPFAQYFYPLSWILYSFCFLLGDLTKHTYLLYSILGISIYNVGQFLWLKKLNFDFKYCFFATLVTCFGLKLNEILRFPNAIHTFAWFSWVLYGMTLSLESKYKVRSSVIIFFSTLFIFTAGYPYYILYGAILFTFYFIFISISNVKTSICGSKKTQNTFWLFLINGAPPILALLIVLPWFIGIKELMEITRDRNIQDITFSFLLSSNLLDQLGSWVFPPISIAEGYYYFGSIITLLIIFYIINFIFEKEKNNLEKYFLIFFFIFFIFNYQFAAAENSYLFKFIWDKVDYIKNFRSFARMNILLIPLFAVLFCLIIKTLMKKKYNINFMLTILISAILIFISQLYIIEFVGIKNTYWETWQQKRLLYASSELTFFSYIFKLYNHYLYSILLFCSAIGIILIKKFNLEKFASFFIITIIAMELFILSNLQWAIPIKYYDSNNYNSLSKEPLEDIKNSFINNKVITEVKGNTYFRNFRRFNINYFDNFGIDEHTKLVDKYFQRDGTFRKSLSEKERQKISLFWGIQNKNKNIFFTTSIDHKTIDSFIDDVYIGQEKNYSNIVLDLDSYNGDQILINIENYTPGYLTFVDNWSPGWKVYIDGNEKKILKVLNSYKSVKINSGNHKIKFKYEPW